MRNGDKAAFNTRRRCDEGAHECSSSEEFRRSGAAAGGGGRGLLRRFRQRARQPLCAGIPTSFDFLDHVAGFGLNQSLIAYSPLSSYARALLVGLLNTMLVSVLAGIFATIIGFAAGFARLSGFWALSKLSR